MSSLEYQKQNGRIDLSYLKRSNKIGHTPSHNNQDLGMEMKEI